MLLLDYTPFLAPSGASCCASVSYAPRLMRRLAPKKPWPAARRDAERRATWCGASKKGRSTHWPSAPLRLRRPDPRHADAVGLGFKFSGAVVELAARSADAAVAIDFTGTISSNGAKIFFGLLFVAIACILMGTGVPTRRPTSSWRRSPRPRWARLACRSLQRTSSSSTTACWRT